jgi:hypothetical protein
MMHAVAITGVESIRVNPAATRRRIMVVAIGDRLNNHLKI